MAQDNKIKKPVMVGTPENAAGAQSGVSTYAPGGQTTAPLNNDLGINPGASSENKAAKWKYPSVSQDVGSEGTNQYQ